MNDKSKLLEAAQIVRDWMVSHYGKGVNLASKCIEASELLIKILHLVGYPDASLRAGWVMYDSLSYGQSPYDAHTWVYVAGYYLDVTCDQFNYGMDPENKFPEILCQRCLPDHFSFEDPPASESLPVLEIHLC